MSGQIGTRCWMRPMASEDFPVMARWFEQLDDLTIFDRHVPLPPNSEAMLATWRRDLETSEPRRGYWFAIDDREGEMVGIAGLQGINYVHGDGVLAVFVATPLRRHGIGTRAAAMLLDLAFDHLRLNRITSYYRADNHASRKMTQTVGFREEGTLRSAWFAGGRHVDIVTIGILGEEWAAERDALSDRLAPETMIVLGRTPWGGRTWPRTADEQREAVHGA